MSNSLINTKKLYCLTMLFACMGNGLYAVDYASAIPVAFDTKKGEWSVLLVLKKGESYWTDISAPRPQGEQANITAGSILETETNNIYRFDTTKIIPWGKEIIGSNTYFLHFVPVDYIQGRDLYTTARGPSINDFIWIYANKLMNPNAASRKFGKKHKIDRTFLNNFKKTWPNAQQKLRRPSGVPTPSAKPSADHEPWKQYNPKANSWSKQNFPDEIYFYASGKDYYEFTNFYQPPTPIIINGIPWPTSEHYYQAMKFTNPQLQEQIRNAPTPRKAFQIGQTHKKRSDWNNISLDVMRTAVRAKFSQDSKLEKLLLDTGDKVIVEDAGKNDAFFGAGGDYKGHNHLGRILMEVRQELRKSQAQQPQPAKKQPQKPVFQKKPQPAPVQKEWWVISAWRRLKNTISNLLSYFWK
jgi:ribA/ribD-fused uncharacterized protein